MDEIFRTAVADALHAPSIFNTQPWQWEAHAGELLLFAEPQRRLPVVDPRGTQLLLSCGAALHHARVSLAAQGFAVTVQRPAEIEGVLARLTIGGRAVPDPAAVALRAAIPHRRTDRRPFGEEPVALPLLHRLESAAAAEGARLHRVRLDQMPMLAVAVAAAEASELASPRYRIELIQWTNRPEWSHDGVPPATGVQRVPRRVGVRDWTPPSMLAARAGSAGLAAEQGLPVPAGGDRGAAYVVLHGPGEEAVDWLRAGEALSAVLLTAVAAGLAVAPFTDVLEVDHPRDLVRGLLPGLSHPYVVVRTGHPGSAELLPSAPRRALDDVLCPGVGVPGGDGRRAGHEVGP